MKLLWLLVLLAVALWPGGSLGQSSSRRGRNYAAVVGICEGVHASLGLRAKSGCSGEERELCCEILAHYRTRTGRAYLIGRSAQGKCRRHRNVCARRPRRKPRPTTAKPTAPSPVPREELSELCRKKRGGCKAQSRTDKARRASVVKALAEALAPPDASAAQKRQALLDAERQTELVQAAKRSLLASRGVADLVEPADDGLYEEDLLLSPMQSEAIVKAVSGPEALADPSGIPSPDQVLADVVRLDGRRQKRSIRFMEEMPVAKWPLPVPYQIDDSIGGAGEAQIKASIRDIESKTCIRFRQVFAPQSRGYILFKDFFDASFCGQSPLGRQEGVNRINLNFNCPSIAGAITHNILHSLGALHEHNRVERDAWVGVEWKNIDPQHWELFDGRPFVRSFSSYGVPYDFHSIMHYGAKTGTLDKARNTITPKAFAEERLKAMGQRRSLSPRDAQKLSKVYCLPDSCKDRHVYCGYYANQAYCTDEKYFAYMNRVCPKSCDLCPSAL